MGRGKRRKPVIVSSRTPSAGASIHLSTAAASELPPATRRHSNEAIQEAWEQGGHNLARTAELLGSHLASTTRWLIKLGLYERQVNLNRAEVIAAVERHGGGWGAYTAAAEELGITPGAVSFHLLKANQRLRRSRPTKEELTAALAQSQGDVTQAARLLGRQPASTWIWMSSEGLIKPEIYESWPTCDRRFLTRHYGSMPLSDLAAKLNRTVAAIHQMATRLGLTHPYISPTIEEVDAMIADISEFEGTFSQWRREHGYSQRLVRELRTRRPAAYESAVKRARRRHGESTSEIGKDFEIIVRKELEQLLVRQHGLKHLIVRDHPLSLGAGDISILGYGKAYEIQAETHGTWRMDKWNRLFIWCTQVQKGTVPLVVRQGPNGPEYFRIVGKKNGERGKRQPMIPWDWTKEAKRLNYRATRFNPLFE